MLTSRVWWRSPQLRADDERSVGWLELFFDLVFVVVISRLAHQLIGEPSLRLAVEFLAQFVAVFWIWNAFTYYRERFESGGIEDRLFVFLALVPVAALAVFADGGLNEQYLEFAIAYLAARVVFVSGCLRAARHVPAFRPVAVRFLVGFAVMASLILVSLGRSADTRLALWIAAVVVDVAVPAFTVRQQAVLPPISADKFPERFGLFTIIVLGESIIGVISGFSELSDDGNLSGSAWAAGPLGLAIGFGLWWVYFDFIARRPPRSRFTAALAWVYLHMATVTTITMAGVGIFNAIADTASGGLRPSSQRMLTGGVGLALVSIALLETTLHRRQDEPTNALVGPARKLAVGGAVLVIGWAPIVWSTVPLLAALVTALAVEAAFGVATSYRRSPTGSTGRW